MATWIGAQQQRLLGSSTGSLGYGSSTTIGISSLDHYAAVRVSAFSLHSSYSILTQFAQDSASPWLVSTAENLSIGSGQALEFKTYGRDGLITLTCGASASMVRCYVHAVPIA